MIDPMFLPIDRREPIEDYDSEFTYEEELEDGVAEVRHKYSKRTGPYIAS